MMVGKCEENFDAPVALEQEGGVSMSLPKLTLSRREAAALMGVSLPVIDQLVHRESFPAFRVGSRVLISRDGLARWVLEQAGARRGGDENAQ